MFSKLSKGYGSWTAGYVDPYFGENKYREHTFPEIDLECHSHIHGVTVGTHSGRSTAMSWTTTKRSREPTLDGIPLPKTYTTKTGALQLYVGPDDENEENQGLELKPKYMQIKRPMGQELIDLSLKFGTIERLAKCVLSFGDQDYDHEHTSISDARTKAFLKFLHSVDGSKVNTTDVDTHAQPGGDLNKYLRDLKSSASNRYSEDGRIYVTKSRESLELQALLRGLDNNSWPLAYGQDGASDRQSTGLYTRPVSQVSFTDPSPMPPSTPRSTYRVLSAKKVAASVKYGTYLGRPSSKLSVDDDDTLDTCYSSPQYVPTTNITRKAWTPTESMDESLLDARGRFCWGTGEEDMDSEDSKKRRRFKERTYLTGSDLYQGRNAQKGEGLCVVEVNGTGKGDGDSVGKGHRMSQIKEEFGDFNDPSKTNIDVRNNNCVQNIVVLEQQINNNAQVIGSHVKDAKFNEREIHIKKPFRPNSKSETSFETRVRTNTPSIITIQTSNASKAQIYMQNKHQILFKKVKSNDMKFDKDISKKLPLRKTTENHLNVIEQANAANDNILTSISDDYSGTLKGGDQTFSPGTFKNWPINAECVPGNTVENIDSHVTYAKQYRDDVQETAAPYPQLFKKSTLGLPTDVSLTHKPPKVIDNKLEEEVYITDDIHEYNVEIQQIKAQGDDHSDTDSSIDEEIFKVMCEGQTLNECEDDMEMYPIIDTSQNDATKCQTNKIEENSFARILCSNVQDGNFVVEDTIGLGETDNADEQMVTSVAKMDTVWQSQEEVEEVTDEKMPEVKSERSSQKFRSSNSLSGAMEDEYSDDIQDTTISSSSQVLPLQQPLDRLINMSEKDAHSIAAELDSLGLRKPADKDGSKHAYRVLPPGPRPKPPPEKVKIPEHIAEALKRSPTASIQQLEQELEKMTELVDETLSGPTLQAIGEGLTEEELELAKLILEKKIAKAKGKLDEKEVMPATEKKKGVSHKVEKKGKKKQVIPKDVRSQEDIDRDTIREKQEAEKMKRDFEAAELQRKIAEKRALLQAQEDMTSAKSKEIRDKMEELEREAEDLQRAEDEARSMLADIRKKQREEREARRKADQDKKKLEAAARREREKREMEEKKKKELALSEKIADAEMRRRIREEEEQKMFEEERLAQERYEEELRKAQEEAEAEEERLKERERQVEEEAMQRLIEEREAAERMRRKLMEEEETMREIERLKMEKIQEEQQKLQEERQRMQEWEKAKREAERERFKELCCLEEEARAKMREEIEKRRADALMRRDYNIENKQNVDKLRHGQGITKAWTFSYFVQWDREKYERRMGTDPKKMMKRKYSAPKKPVEVKPVGDVANNQAPP